MVMADDDDDSDCLCIDERDPGSPENDKTDDQNIATVVVKNITTELRNIRRHSELPPINYFPLMKNIDLKTIESDLKEEKPRITCKDFSRVPFDATNTLLAGSNVVDPLADLEQFTNITMAAAEVNLNADGSIQLHVPETALTVADNPIDLTGYSNMTQVMDPMIPPNGNVMTLVQGATMNANRQISVIVPNSASPSPTVVVESPIQRHDGFNTPNSPTSVNVDNGMPTGLHSKGPPPPYRPPPSGNLLTASTSSYHLPSSANNEPAANASYGPPPAQRPDDLSSNLLTMSSTAYDPPSAQSLPTPMNSNYEPHYGHPQMYPDAYRRQMYSHNSHAEYYGQAPANNNQRPYTNYPGGPYPTMGHLSNPQHHMRMSPCMTCRMGMPCYGPRLPPPNPGPQGVPTPPWIGYEQAYGRTGPTNATYKGRDIQDYLAEMREHNYMAERKKAEMQRSVRTSGSATKPMKATSKRTYAKISTNSNTRIVVNSNPVINNPGANVSNATGHNIPNWEALINGETKKPAEPSEIEPKSPPCNSLWPPNMPNGPMALQLLKTQVTRTNNITISLVDSTSGSPKKPKTNNIPDKTQKANNPEVHSTMNMNTSFTEDITTMVNNVEPTNYTTMAFFDSACIQKPTMNNTPNKTQKQNNTETHSTMNMNTNSSKDITIVANNVERPNNTTVALVDSTSACPKKPKINNAPSKIQKNNESEVHSTMHMNTSSAEDITTMANDVEQPYNTIATIVDSTSACIKKPTMNNTPYKTQKEINTEVYSTKNINTSSSEDIITMVNHVKRPKHTTVALVDSTSAYTQEPGTNNISDETREAVNKEVNSTMYMNTSSSKDITTMADNGERTYNNIVPLVESTSACIQKPETNNTPNKTQKEINTEVHSTMNTSKDIPTVTYNDIAASDIETTLVVDLTDDTDSLQPTELAITPINRDDKQIPLIMEQDAEIGHTKEADFETVNKTVREVAFVEPAPKITDIPEVLTMSNTNNGKGQINVTPTSNRIQSNAYQVKMSTTSTTTEKYLHSVEGNAVSRSDTLTETGFNTFDHRIETKVTVELFSQISVEDLKNILNTVSSVQTYVEDTVNDADTTHGISQTNALANNETTVCQESKIVSEDHKLEIARKKLALLSAMERKNEDNSCKDVNENVQTNTGSNYQEQISTEVNSKYFGQFMISQERLQDNCSTGAYLHQNNEIILHSERNQEIEVLSIDNDQENNVTTVTSETGENINNTTNRLTEAIIDETLFFKFQVNFFRLVQERLSENNCHELAYELRKDIHDLIAVSDDETAKADMKYKCHMCLNVAIYSPRSLYYKQANHLEKSLAKVQSCPLCITFRKKYVEILMKYIKIEAPNDQSHSEITPPDHVEEDIIDEKDDSAKKEIDDDEIENQLSLITNGVPLSPKQAEIDVETSHNSNPLPTVNSTTEDGKNNNFVVKLPTSRLKESTIAALWKKIKCNMMKSNIRGSSSNNGHDNNDRERKIIHTETNSNKHLDSKTTNAISQCHNNNLKNKVSHDITQNNSVVVPPCTDTETALKRNDLVIKNNEKHHKRKASISIDTPTGTNPELQSKNIINMDVPSNHVTHKPRRKSVTIKIHLDPNPEQNRVILNDDNTDQDRKKHRILKKSISHDIATHKKREHEKRNTTSTSTDQEKHHKRRKSMNFEIASNKNTLDTQNIVDTSKNHDKHLKLKMSSAESARCSNSESHDKVTNPTSNNNQNDKKQEKHRKDTKSINVDTEPNQKLQKRNTNTDDIKKNHEATKNFRADIDSTKVKSLNLDANSASNNNKDTSITRKSSTNSDPESTEALKIITSNSPQAENAEKVKTNSNDGNEKSNDSDARNDHRKVTGDTNPTSNNNQNDKKQEEHRKVMKSINADTERNRKPHNRNTNTDDIKRNHEARKNVSADIDSTNVKSVNLNANDASNNKDTSIARKSPTNNDRASTEALKDIKSNPQGENAEKIKTSNNDGNEKTNDADARNDNRKATGEREKNGRETTEENNTNNKRKLDEDNDANAKKSIEAVAKLQDCSKILKENSTNEEELPEVKISGKRRKSKSKRDCVTDISYKFMCHICTVSFSYLQSCLSHMSHNHQIEKPKVPSYCVTKKCPFCSLYISNSTYNYHVQSAHEDKYSHIVKQQ